ncbi:curlin repeat-containing protein [Methylobacterium sp. Gmos1]
MRSGHKAFAVLAGLAAGLAAGAAAAQALSVTQMRQANVYGTVQVGPQVRPTDVTQVGRANVVGIMQAGANPRASVTQTGRTNSAFIGQYETFLPRGGSRMP